MNQYVIVITSYNLTYAGQQQESCTRGAQANDQTDSVRSRAEMIGMLPHSQFQESTVDRRRPVLLAILAENVTLSLIRRRCNEIVEKPGFRGRANRTANAW